MTLRSGPGSEPVVISHLAGKTVHSARQLRLKGEQFMKSELAATNAIGCPEKELLPFVRRLLSPEKVLGMNRIGRGQSNPTYALHCAQRKLVLRSKPPGVLLRSAHLVEREFRVMSALRHTAVPVPEMVALVNDGESPLGRAFYIMEFVDGDVHFDPFLPELDVSGRRVVYDEMNRVLTEIHGVDATAVGLSEFGRPGNYFARQTAKWKRQYYAARITPNRDMDKLADWLEANMVENDKAANLVHGDYRLDNLIFGRTSLRVLAVVDWELSTLGHPMADIAYQCMQWRMSHEGPLRGLGGVCRSEWGLPKERQYLEDYCRRRRIPVPKNWSFYLVFSFFRFAAILEGVGRRAIEGNAANPEMAVEYGKQVPMLARAAMEALDQES